MRLSLSEVESGSRRPDSSILLWLEKEIPEEIALVEELKKKQRAIEQELARQRRQQAEQQTQVETPPN
jgi:hypothetical protein